MSAEKVYLIGTPGAYAGATVEAWHLVRLWRRVGIDVHVVPTWGIDERWKGKIEAEGCIVHLADESTLLDVPGIRGAVTVGLCNKAYLKNIPRLYGAGCKIVWLNCMTFTFKEEVEFFNNYPPHMMVYHTQFQKTELENAFSAAGVRIDQNKTTIIRGAFIKEDFPFAPRRHIRMENFCVGKIARMDLDKWYPELWKLRDLIQKKTPNRITMALMGADRRVRNRLGPQPVWTVLLNANAVSPSHLYRAMHCLLPLNGGARENWPRVGLEAMASGVPIVAPNAWGWKEMIKNAETGLLGSSDEEIANHVANLANDEQLRMFIIEAAYKSLDEIANPDTIGNQWKELIGRLS